MTKSRGCGRCQSRRRAGQWQHSSASASVGAGVDVDLAVTVVVFVFGAGWVVIISNVVARKKTSGEEKYPRSASPSLL